MHITVIIPTRNRVSTLENTIDSLLEQTLDKSNYEILIMDQSTNHETRDFINNLNGWAYHVGQGGVHTVTGGNDTTFYTGLIQVSNEIPKGFVLYQNYPNPFNPSTRIKFELPKKSFVKLIVYDISGREIIKLVDKNLTAGSYETEWIGSGYPSGVYFYRLSADGNAINTRKMLLIK